MFNLSFDKRIVYIIIAIMILSTIAQYITNPGALFALLVSVPGVLLAITFHEFAHGFAAYKLGDNTAKNEGRLSLNPLDHLDPIGTLMLLFAGFGWGKISMEKGEAIVSVAGPLTNILLAILLALGYEAFVKFASIEFLLSTVGNIIKLMMGTAISINIGLGIFNLIPLPPLDGSKIIMPFLPYNAKQWFKNNEQIFYIIFVVIWITGIASVIISPAINGVTSGIMAIAKAIFG